MLDQLSLTITFFAISWLENELRPCLRQFPKREKLTNVFEQPFFGKNSIPNEPSPLEGTGSVAHFISQTHDPITSKAVNNG